MKLGFLLLTFVALIESKRIKTQKTQIKLNPSTVFDNTATK